MRCRKGTTSLEFAIVGALFFAMLIGTMEVGRFYFTQQSLREVTAAAARRAMVDASFSGCAAPLEEVAGMTPLLRSTSLTLCVTRTTSAGLTTLTVDAAYPFAAVLPMLQLDGNQLTDRTTVTFSND
ncbi:TadE family protein [Geminicoccus harenae]|uniref:TadE family protein n=1 Tax=Geminicoccus harenae TaxID=2498453 RepID=UPI00168A813F|nr:TadE/TadG family type IV pilus assembly protein [Geminicoccus harenae]